MKEYIMDKLKLTESGATGVIQSTVSFVFYYLSFLFPMMVLMLFANGVLEGTIKKPSLFTIVLFLILIIMYFIINKNYQVTYNETYKESANLRIEIANFLRKMPLSYFSKHDLSDLAQTIMQDVAQVEHALAHAIGNYIGFVLYFALMSVMMLSGNWKMGLSIIGPVLLAVGVIFATKKMQISFRTKHFEALRKISEDFQTTIEMNQEIKSYGLKDSTRKEIQKSLIESEKLQWKSELIQVIPLSLAQYIGILPIGFCIFVGVNLLLTNEISMLYFLGYLIAAAKISGGVLGLASYLGEIFYLDVRIKRIGEIKEHSIQEGKEIPLTNFDIELSNVSFGYDEDQTVINGLSFTVNQGEVTALIGPSGCGKTTILRLISRLYDYDTGSISIGDHDIKNIDTEHLFKYISIVFQDVILFNTSVMENIRIGNVKATNDEVKKAAKEAGCEDFIQNLPDGYDTFIGENGSKLSGGERQRLSIARAILKDTPIIILDEIAASLDVENELNIQGSLNKLIKDKTVIVISHRLKSIENVDKIVVLDQGRVNAVGKHEDLLKKSELYRTMIEKSLITEGHRY
ncbi:ABC transporter ATP-binding protein [Facklamia miroungae]|uniref:ATP-binding cassette, subfamily B n=1 Tax=Facklamia miroungae TaxID=120956 RepID=A0A1G7UBC6_9LACT|nr:ABC transporter ATP-binding protein [Facklamia miroungae]NKZ30036.1 ABC transporter ATP-binding protein [Facklamia miroungae]SDG44678.1 ATP-binding cassette, subfamily B [Facklamia miroungae]